MNDKAHPKTLDSSSPGRPAVRGKRVLPSGIIVVCLVAIVLAVYSAKSSFSYLENVTNPNGSLFRTSNSGGFAQPDKYESLTDDIKQEVFERVRSHFPTLNWLLYAFLVLSAVLVLGGASGLARPSFGRTVLIFGCAAGILLEVTWGACSVVVAIANWEALSAVAKETDTDDPMIVAMLMSGRWQRGWVMISTGGFLLARVSYFALSLRFLFSQAMRDAVLPPPALDLHDTPDHQSQPVVMLEPVLPASAPAKPPPESAPAPIVSLETGQRRDTRDDDVRKAPADVEKIVAALPPQRPGMVSQVKLFGVLWIMQGGAELLFGSLFLCFCLLLAVGAIRPTSMPELHREPVQQNLPINMVLTGIGPVLAGGLRVIAGFRVFQFRSRWLGFFSLPMSIFALPTCLFPLSCWLAPTSILLGLYGLFVLMNREVGLAFRLRKQGASIDQIYAAFSPSRRRAFAKTPPFPPA